MQSTPSDIRFAYDSLVNPKSIRLLRVLPHKFEGRIQVRLWEATEGARYKCLSYTWGDEFDTQTVQINGHIASVGRNLLEFLEVAVLRYPEVNLWIDALCINQSDDAEKSLQVQRMGDIYKNATHVLAWFGNHKGIRNLLTRVEEYERRSKDVFYHLKDENQLWSICKDLAEHPYWNRAWIIQEIVLAQRLRLLSGSIETCPMALQRLLGPELRYSQDMIRISNLLNGVSRYGDVIPFWYIFYQLGNELECHDPQDRIYSLLSITGQESLKVDYSESIVGMFWRSAEHFSAWRCPRLVTLFWHALGITQDLIEEAFMEGYQRLWIDIPVRPARLNSALQCRQRRCVVGRAQINGCPGNEVTGNVVVLCPSTNLASGKWSHGQNPEAYDEEYRVGFDQENIHVLVSTLNASTSDGFSISINSHDFGTMPYSHTIELWFIENGIETRVMRWIEFIRLAGLCRITHGYGDAWRSRPHFSVRMAHHWPLACVQFFSAQGKEALRESLRTLEGYCTLTLGSRSGFLSSSSGLDNITA